MTAAILNDGLYFPSHYHYFFFTVSVVWSLLLLDGCDSCPLSGTASDCAFSFTRTLFTASAYFQIYLQLLLTAFVRLFPVKVVACAGDNVYFFRPSLVPCLRLPQHLPCCISVGERNSPRRCCRIKANLQDRPLFKQGAAGQIVGCGSLCKCCLEGTCQPISTSTTGHPGRWKLLYFDF